MAQGRPRRQSGSIREAPGDLLKECPDHLLAEALGFFVDDRPEYMEIFLRVASRGGAQFCIWSTSESRDIPPEGTYPH